MLWLVPTSPPPAAACCPVCSPQPVTDTAVGQAFAAFLRLEVAQGAATSDTQRGYWSQVRAWAAWCQAQACCLATAPATAATPYRQALVVASDQPASIAHKLAVLRRFYAAAVAEDLRADNPALGHRLNAARAAVRVAAGEGADVGQHDDKERAALRRKALDWLRVDLTAWKKLAAGKPLDAKARALLTDWQQTPGLSSVRDAALAKLPADEQAAWKQLWADVRFIPLGEYWQATAYRKDLADVLPGCFATFYGVRRI